MTMVVSHGNVVEGTDRWKRLFGVHLRNRNGHGRLAGMSAEHQWAEPSAQRSLPKQRQVKTAYSAFFNFS